MNYIGMINNFWRVDAEYSFTGNETKLYMYLLHFSNRLGWKNPFRLSYRQIELGSALTVNTVVSARNKLKEAGLISFTIGKKGCPKNIDNKTTYELRLSKIDNHPEDQPDNLSDNHADSQPDNQPDDLSGNQPDNHVQDIIKQETRNLNLNPNPNPGNNPPSVPPGETAGGDEAGKGEDSPGLTEEEGKEKSCAKKESPPLALPFVSERFLTAWRGLCDSGKWRDKSDNALQTALNQLSRFEEDFAVWLVEAAAVNNWQAVVFPDTVVDYRKWKTARKAPPGVLNVANHDNSKVYENF